jgi:DNA repair protein RecO (recombination protein O)
LIRFDAVRGGSLCLNCAGTSGIPVALGTVGSLARSLNVNHQQFNGFSFGKITLQEAGCILYQVLRQILPREPKSLKLLS